MMHSRGRNARVPGHPFGGKSFGMVPAIRFGARGATGHKLGGFAPHWCSNSSRFCFAFALGMGNLRPAMAPQEEPSPSSKPSESNRSAPRRRSRRGGRGRRRGPRPNAEPAAGAASGEAPEPIQSGPDVSADEPERIPSAQAPDEDFAPSELPLEEAHEEFTSQGQTEDVRSELEESPAEDERHLEAPIERREDSAPEERPAPPPRRDFRPAAPAAVTEAIDLVNRSIASLKEVLEQMEEVLETLELAEIQKTADEREIRSLLDAMRHFDRRDSEPRREGTSAGSSGRESRGRDQRRDRRR